MDGRRPVPNRKNHVPRGADSTLTTAWSMGGRLCDLAPHQLDLVATHIAQLPLTNWPEWLIEVQMQIDPQVIRGKLEQKT